MCPMCDEAIGDDPPAVCPRCGWELLQLEESPAWVSTLEASMNPRLVEPASQNR